MPGLFEAPAAPASPLVAAAFRRRGFLPQFRFSVAPFRDRSNSAYRRRTTGFVLALLVEALLVLVIATLGTSIGQHDGKSEKTTIVRFRASEEQPEKKQETEKPRAKPEFREAEEVQAPKAEPEKQPPQIQPRPDKPAPAAAIIPLAPSQMAAVDISKMPSRSPPAVKVGPPMGPADTGFALKDTPRVGGSGPNGEPLYAAAWYREPYPDELSGYLSTASGPGWGLIACRTASQYRVEDCVTLDEFPVGSRISNAAAAAAWQFRVRPPRVGGKEKIGEWVRIRIDYGVRVGPRR